MTEYQARPRQVLHGHHLTASLQRFCELGIIVLAVEMGTEAERDYSLSCTG